MMANDKIERNPASFRDRAGFVFTKENQIFRAINNSFAPEFEYFQNNLYPELVTAALIVQHSRRPELDFDAHTVVQPARIPFVSYPYEWCFEQLRDAALITLEIQALAVKSKMSLRDASAYNIQFIDSRPIFIDTLSFQRWSEGQPWVAYGQFCRHFLAPLLLMSKRDIRMNQLLKGYLDGVPLDLTAKLLPLVNLMAPRVLVHIGLHAWSEKRFSQTKLGSSKSLLTEHKTFSLNAMLGLIDSLRSLILGLSWKDTSSVWGDYYNQTSYSEKATQSKAAIVEKLLQAIAPRSTWDLGANDGFFGRIVQKYSKLTVCFDSDYASVSKNYRNAKEQGHKILSLVMNLANPSSGIGWAHEERASLLQRGPVDLCLALALIHHIVISCGIPLKAIAKYLSQLCSNLIIEFVPKTDQMVGILLQNREDIFDDYTREGFQSAFFEYFVLVEVNEITDSGRVVFWMKNRKSFNAS